MKRARLKKYLKGCLNSELKNLNKKISIDYFAVSLPDLLIFDADLDLLNKVHCLYLMGLGNIASGNGNSEKAEQLLGEVLRLNPNHQGAIIHKQMLQRFASVEQ